MGVIFPEFAKHEEANTRQQAGGLSQLSDGGRHLGISQPTPQFS